MGKYTTEAGTKAQKYQKPSVSMKTAMFSILLALIVLTIGNIGRVAWNQSGWPVGDGIIVRKAVLQDGSESPHVLVLKFGNRQLTCPVSDLYWKLAEPGGVVPLRERSTFFGKTYFVEERFAVSR